MEAKLKHLEFIQSVITRMAANSFMLKGWAVVIVSAIFALSAKDANVAFVSVAYLPAFVFWGLDAYYLHQERLFRELYKHVAQMDASEIDFSMNTSPFKNSVSTWLEVCLSATILPFHAAIVIVVFIVMTAVYKAM